MKRLVGSLTLAAALIIATGCRSDPPATTKTEPPKDFKPATTPPPPPPAPIPTK